MSEDFIARDRFLPFGRPSVGRKEESAVLRVIRSGWLGMGPETIAFEEDLARVTGARGAVSVNSCTSALYLSLVVSGVGAGDEVIVPSFTWCSSVSVVLHAGATPVFCDVSPDTFNADFDSILGSVSSRTKAVIVVHMGGLALDVKELRRRLPKRIRIIEDAAHAMGARYEDGTPVGSSGNLVCFSFYANKNIATGEGGAIVLANRRDEKRLKSLRVHGLSADAWSRYSRPSRVAGLDIKEVGYKMNFTDLQAAIGRVQLSRMDAFTRTRRKIARHYLAWLRKSDHGLVAQQGLDGEFHARHLFQVLLPGHAGSAGRDRLVGDLRKANIGAAIHYTPVHQLTAYRHLASDGLRVTEDIGRRVLTLPISASMTVADAKDVTRTIDALLAGQGAAAARETAKVKT